MVSLSSFLKYSHIIHKESYAKKANKREMIRNRNHDILSLSLEELLKEAEPIESDLYFHDARADRTKHQMEMYVMKFRGLLIDDGLVIRSPDSDNDYFDIMKPENKNEKTIQKLKMYHWLAHNYFKPEKEVQPKQFGKVLWKAIIENIDSNNKLSEKASASVKWAIVQSGLFSSMDGRRVIAKVCNRFDKKDKGIPKPEWSALFLKMSARDKTVVEDTMRDLYVWATNPIVSIDPQTKLLTIPFPDLEKLEAMATS